VKLERTRYGRPFTDRMTLEEPLRARLERTFYMVGPALAAYMICDWQLCPWTASRTEVFATYKQDALHWSSWNGSGADGSPLIRRASWSGGSDESRAATEAGERVHLDRDGLRDCMNDGRGG
jgi:hypothetical protein